MGIRCDWLVVLFSFFVCGLVMSLSYQWCHLLFYFLKEPIIAWGLLCFILAMAPVSISLSAQHAPTESASLAKSMLGFPLSMHPLECYCQVASRILFLLHLPCKGQVNLPCVLVLIHALSSLHNVRGERQCHTLNPSFCGSLTSLVTL